MKHITSSHLNNNKNTANSYLLLFSLHNNTVYNDNNNNNIHTNKTTTTLLRRKNSGDRLHTKTQTTFTICICILLLFFSLIFFTLRPPTTTRHLYLNKRQPSVTRALHNMGTLYTRGTRKMNHLIICHLTDSVTVNEVSIFLRVFFRSSLYSKSDIVFVFDYNSALDDAIRLESELFFRIVTRFDQGNDSAASFSGAHFVRRTDSGGTIWGRRSRKGNSSDGNVTGLTRLSYGSVVAFDVDELDSENSLGGFLDDVPMSLRRWVCYTLLLGEVRKHFKHVMLVDLKDLLLLGDPLSRVKNPSLDSVYLSTCPTPSGKNPERSHGSEVSPSLIFGGARGIRRLSNVMITEIVRAAMQRKRKKSVIESEVLSELVKNEFLLKNIKVMVSSELIAEASSLNSAGSLVLSNHTVVQCGNSDDIIMKYICSFPQNSLVYSDC